MTDVSYKCWGVIVVGGIKEKSRYLYISFASYNVIFAGTFRVSVTPSL